MRIYIVVINVLGDVGKQLAADLIRRAAKDHDIGRHVVVQQKLTCLLYTSGALRDDEPAFLQLLNILPHGVVAHPHRLADGGIAGMALICLLYTSRCV